MLKYLDVEITAKYRAQVNQVFDIIERCGAWGDLERETDLITQVDIVGMDNGRTIAYNHGNGRETIIALLHPFFNGTANFKPTPTNQAFILLHEVRHGYFRRTNQYTNQHTLDLAEEIKCDSYAHQVLLKGGYQHSVIMHQ